MKRRWMLIALVGAVALWLLLSAGSHLAASDLALSPMAPPADAIPLWEDPGLEADPPDLYWTLSGDAEVTTLYAYEGEHSLVLGGTDAWGWAERTLDLSPCREGPVWIEAAYAIQTALPLDPIEAGYDITEGWIYNSKGLSVVTLWTRYDSDYTSGWETPWIRVDNLFSQGPKLTLRISAETNANPASETFFFNDKVQVWCLPLNPAPVYRVMLPVAISELGR